ncbi:MAG: MoaD/ThiS family protein [Chloroflexi bacterium]|nr:MoaD/ThiS family protein [Chloroflexota bacterium]
MNIKVLYDSLFSDITGCHEETVALAIPTASSLIEALCQRHGPEFRDAAIDPGSGDLKPQVALLVNGRRQPYDAPIAEGAEVAFLVPIAGGTAHARLRRAPRSMKMGFHVTWSAGQAPS